MSEQSSTDSDRTGLDRQALIKRLARTYNGINDPYQRIENYRRVNTYAADHPSKGSAAIANALGFQRSRIRPWVDGD